MQPAIGDHPAVKKNAPKALGFQCANCASEFESRQAMDCRRRHPSYEGTAGADAKNSKSISYIARANVSPSMLRQHEALDAGTLHVQPYQHSGAHCMFMQITCTISIIKSN